MRSSLTSAQKSSGQSKFYIESYIEGNQDLRGSLTNVPKMNNLFPNYGNNK